MKHYRLKKPLPNFSEGVDLIWDERELLYKSVGLDTKGQYLYYHPDIVQNNPEWFEEVKEEEPIKVMDIMFYQNLNTIKVIISKEIARDELSKIKKAIEYILNDKEGIWSDEDMIYFAKKAVTRLLIMATHNTEDDDVLKGHLETYKTKKS